MDLSKFINMEPMKYYNNENAVPKRQAMIDNKDNLYVASEKHDGCWGLFIHGENGFNLIRSRSISKVTGTYGDETAKLPHLVEEMNTWPDNTVVLAEIWWGEYGTNTNTVGTIMRCLPAKAIERQKEHKLVASIFDVLMVNGEDISNIAYEKRIKDYAPHMNGNYFSSTSVFENDFQFHADEIIRNGGEGVVIQKKSNPYMPGTRTAWATLKLKQKMDAAEYLVIGTLEPNKIYDGDCAETWQFKLDDGTLVTKPYYYGWKNGVTIMLPSGIECDVASGLTDADREWLATGEATEMIAKHEVFAEVAAMSINDLGKLRHPYLIRLRTSSDGANEK